MTTKILPFLFLLAGAPAFAHERGGERLMQKLDLSPAESAAVKATFEKFRPQLEPLRKDAWQTRSALRDELTKATPDERRVAQLTDQLQSDRQQMRTVQAQKMSELRGELSPSQFAKLVTSRHGRFHHGRGGNRNEE